MSVPQPATDDVRRLHHACEAQSPEDMSAAMQAAMDAIAAGETTAANFAAGAAQGLKSLSPEGASWLAIMLGSMVERGQDPHASWPLLLARYRALLRSFGGDQPDAISTDQADELSRDDVLTKFSQSMVSHLARMPEERESLLQDNAFLDALMEAADSSHGPAWVYEAVAKVSDHLVVIHVESAQGYRVEYRNIENCFHLFSLLQQAISDRLPGGRQPGADTQQAWWHYGDATSPTADLMASIWGEASPRSIPAIDGEQVLLLWPPLLQGRGWGQEFCGPHLEAMPAEVVMLAPLTDREANDWLVRLGVRQRKKRWWQWIRRQP